MRKFVLKSLIFGLFCISFSVLFPYLLDPFNVFHYDHMRDNGVEPNNNYIKMRHILDHPDAYDAFLFGSSRVGPIDETRIAGHNCFSMNYSEGLPSEHLSNISTLIENGIKPKSIYIGIDSLSYTINPEEHKSQPIRMPYEYLRDNPRVFYETYLNSGLAFMSLGVVMNHKEETGEGPVVTLVDDGNLKPTIGNDMDIDGCIETISQIKQLCDENGIKVVFFTNPMYKVTHEASVKKGYYAFLSKLSEVTEYYNFSGINDITNDPTRYSDTSHYHSDVGDMIVDAICFGRINEDLFDQGFGVCVNKDNSDYWIRILKQNDE